jgi:hypothetical protein
MNRLHLLAWVLNLGLVMGSMALAGPPDCADENGDTNGDKARDLSDAVYALTFQFQGGPEPVPFCNPAGAGEGCASENGDTNGDKARDLSDAVYALTFQFQGGPAPVEICVTVICTDDDNDGVGNGDGGNTGCVTTTTDSNDGDANQCADDDGDGCDDCSSGIYDPASDGTDTDSDGICDVGDNCSDSDGVGNGSLGNTGCVTTTTDSNDGNPNECADDNNDTCDDCASGSYSTLVCGGTYADVQPIFQAKCTPCHDGAAPGTCFSGGGACFASLYEETQKDSGHCMGLKVYECILIRILEGSMPLAAGCTGDPVQDAGNNDCLTAGELTTVEAWVAADAPE